MPRIMPDARYRSIPSSVVGGLVFRKDARNCWPWVRSFTQVPLIWMNSPALISAARPTTVTRSLWPRTLTRSTQNPFSGLWKVTRSTRPARASLVAVWAMFATSFAPFPESALSALLTGGTIDRQTLAHDGEQHHLESDN